MLLRLVTPPTQEPVTLAEAKTHLRLETSEDDAYLATLIQAAREHVEGVCRRGLVTQEWEAIFERFPASGVLELAKGDLVSVTSVTYVDEVGASQTLPPPTYEADTVSVPGRLVLAYGQSWPTTRCVWNAVRVRFTVGWDAASVPAPIRQALLLLVAQMYEHRTPEVTGTIISKVAFSVEALLSTFRVLEV